MSSISISISINPSIYLSIDLSLSPYIYILHLYRVLWQSGRHQSLLGLEPLNVYIRINK